MELAAVQVEAVQKWLDYRRQLYWAFFGSSDEELGRQAFLQHLMRRALRAGLPRHSLIWNTEDGLLQAIREVDLQEGPSNASLSDLVRRYRLLEPTRKLLAVAIEDSEQFRVLSLPQATDWIEKQLSTADFEPFVIMAARRRGASERGNSFPRSFRTICSLQAGR